MVPNFDLSGNATYVGAFTGGKHQMLLNIGATIALFIISHDACTSCPRRRPGPERVAIIVFALLAAAGVWF